MQCIFGWKVESLQKKIHAELLIRLQRIEKLFATLIYNKMQMQIWF